MCVYSLEFWVSLLWVQKLWTIWTNGCETFRNLHNPAHFPKLALNFSLNISVVSQLKYINPWMPVNQDVLSTCCVITVVFTHWVKLTWLKFLLISADAKVPHLLVFTYTIYLAVCLFVFLASQPRMPSQQNSMQQRVLPNPCLWIWTASSSSF